MSHRSQWLIGPQSPLYVLCFFIAVSPSDKTVPNDTKRQDDTLADKSSGDASSTNTRHAGSTDSRTTGGATALGFGTPSSNLFSQGTHEALPSKSQNGCVIFIDRCHTLYILFN